MSGPPQVPAEPTVEQQAMMERLNERTFMKLQLPVSDQPQGLFGFFADCDRAIGDLAIALRTQEIDETNFLVQAKRLSGMKLAVAERLSRQEGLTPHEKKRAVAAQVESLSHLTGSGDVEAARRLRELAVRLASSDDRDLSHQGKLVMLGFQLNQLQEGQVKDPQKLLADIDQLFMHPEDRGPVEFMALERCVGILKMLGYENEARLVIERLVREFRDAAPDLSMRAWIVETDGSVQLLAFNEAIRAIVERTETDPSRLASAAVDLLKAFPSNNTLWHVARQSINVEFGGNVAAASALCRAVADRRAQMPSGPLTPEIESILDSHARRLALLGKPLVLDELKDFDDRSFDWSRYRGKVVLVCFWTSLDMRSLDEINRLRSLKQQVNHADFEIVSINIDDANFTNAQQMVARQNYPWATVRSSHPTQVGYATPVAKRLGVNAVPMELLVDRESRVVAIHTVGDNTLAQIQELLAP